MRTACALLFALLVCGSALAAKFDGVPIAMHRQLIAMGKLVMGVPDPSTASYDAAVTSEKLKANIGTLLASAKGKPDLLKAVKEYHIAALSYFASPTASTEATLDDKSTAVDMELQLLGEK